MAKQREKSGNNFHTPDDYRLIDIVDLSHVRVAMI